LNSDQVKGKSGAGPIRLVVFLELTRVLMLGDGVTR